MTTDQIILFSLLVCVFGLLIWGRWRYDLVAFGALTVALILGVVDVDNAFSGFGHPATVIIALVLVVSRGLSNSGAIELIAKYVVDASRALWSHIAVMSGVGAALSAVMNNVGALALLMPIDIQAAEKAKRSPALTLMPLSFATILGGLVTLIGTPPNIIIASFRGKMKHPDCPEPVEQCTRTLEPFSMFDFSPVGLVCAVAGVAFVALIGWRLIPESRSKQDVTKELFKIDAYVAEVMVPEESKIIGKQVRELDELVEDADVAIVGLVRRGKRLPGQARRQEIRAGDILVLEAVAKSIDAFVGETGLKYVGADKHGGPVASGDLSLMEVVVPTNARIEGRSALQLRILNRHGITLLGVSRHGRQIRERVRKLAIEAGDVLLLLGPSERLPEITEWIGGLPLAERGLQVINRQMALLASGIFAVAILLASLGVLYLPVALAAACVAMVLLNIVPLRDIYTTIEWPVIVLLGSMIPIGAALEASGGTSLLAQGIVDIAAGAPAWVVLTLLMVVTMTLSDVLNNTATTVIAAPIAIDIATKLGVNPDPFLMAVAIAASCAFLTPIGHKNNTLIMGPGGYQFGDYWRMGLPLEVIVIAVAIPMILVVWPF
ncbi:MAG: SLC13 family permease [Hyphomicrobiaceae bacterium]